MYAMIAVMQCQLMMPDKGIRLLSCMHECDDCSDALLADDGRQGQAAHLLVAGKPP